MVTARPKVMEWLDWQQMGSLVEGDWTGGDSSATWPSDSSFQLASAGHGK